MKRASIFIKALPLAVVVPILFIPLVPLIAVANWYYPNYPKIHFPPIGQ